MGVRHFVLRGGITCVTCRINVYAWHTRVCLHDSLICATFLMRMCGMSHSYLGVTCLINLRWVVMHSRRVWHDSFVCVTLHFNICIQFEYLYVTWLTHVRGVAVYISIWYKTDSHVWHDSCTSMRDMMHLCVRGVAVFASICKMTDSHIVTHMNESCHT